MHISHSARYQGPAENGLADLHRGLDTCATSQLTYRRHLRHTMLTGRVELLNDFEWFRILIPLSRRVRFDFRDLSMSCINYTILYTIVQLLIQHIPSFYRLHKL